MLQEKLSQASDHVQAFRIGDFLPDPERLRAGGLVPPAVQEEIRQAGRDAMEQEIPALPATLYMECRRNGNRSHFEELYFQRRILLVRMLKGWCFGEESPQLLDAIINMISAICDEWSWVVPAHNWPNDERGKALPPVEPPCVDLFAANTACLIGLCRYYMKEALSIEADRLVERMERECHRRCIKPFLENDRHWWMGFKQIDNHGALNNWTPWIIDNSLHCLLCLEEDEEGLKDVAKRASVILNNYLDVLPSDGGCDEGPIYWDHAAGSLFGCLDLLDFITDHQLELSSDPFMKKVASYIHRVHIQNSFYANFADTPGVLDHMPFALMFRMGKALDDIELCKMAYQLDRESKHEASKEEAFSVHRDYRNFTVPIEELPVETRSDEVSADIFPKTEVFIRNEGKFFFSCKGGHNGESHNHNDVGQFMLYWDGQPGIIDPGVEDYTRDTFNENRYTIWTMQSGWHNLPLINGIGQKEGTSFSSSFFEGNKEFCRVGIASAYPETAGVLEWTRKFDFTGKDKLLSLNEQWGLDFTENVLQWNFMSLCEPLIDNSQIRFPLADEFLVLSFSSENLQCTKDFVSVPPEDEKMGCWGKSQIWRVNLSGNFPARGELDFQFSIEGK